MEWLWIMGAVGLALYLWHRRRLSNMPAAPEPTPRGLNMASDRELLLATFRRELANYMVRQDPDRFLRLYYKARAAETVIEKGEIELNKAQLTILTNRYPFYQDFDFVGARDHVLYSDALQMHEIEDIEEHYLNLVKFHALQRAMNPDWVLRGPATTDEDREHLSKYRQKIKDTRFRQRLVAAVDQFYTFRKEDISKDTNNLIPVFETKHFAVYGLLHMVETRFGFHFKAADEFGIYSYFHDSDRDKLYESFYRSDSLFSSEIYLDYIRIDDPT